MLSPNDDLIYQNDIFFPHTDDLVSWNYDDVVSPNHDLSHNDDLLSQNDNFFPHTDDLVSHNYDLIMMT